MIILGGLVRVIAHPQTEGYKSAAIEVLIKSQSDAISFAKDGEIDTCVVFFQ